MSHPKRSPQMGDYLGFHYVGDPVCRGALGLVAWTGSYWNLELPLHRRRFREQIHLAEVRDGALENEHIVTAGGDLEHSPCLLPDGSVLFLSNADAMGEIPEHGVLEVRIENQFLNAPQLYRYSGGKAKRLTGMLHGVNWYRVSPGHRKALLSSWQYEGDSTEAMRRSPSAQERLARAFQRQEEIASFDRQRFKSDAEYGYCSQRSETLWLLDLEKGNLSPLLGGDDEFNAPCWLDDHRILFETACPDDGIQFHVVDIAADDPRPEKLAHAAGVRMCFDEDVPALVTPDGSAIIFAGNAPGDEYADPRGLYAIPADARGSVKPRRLIDPERDIDGILPQDMNFACRDHGGAEYMAHSDGHVYYATGVDGDVRVARVPWRRENSAPERVTPTLTNCHSLSAWNEGTLLALYATPTAMPELALIDIHTGEASVLTHTNPQLDDVAIVKPVKVHSSTGIQGFYYPPQRDADKPAAPVLVAAHGGPTGFYCSALNYEMACLAAAGFGVLCPNPRSSTGFGRAYSKDAYAYDGAAMGDIILLLDELCLEHPELDHQRAGIFGGSYGGYITLWAAGHCTRFRAASAIRPLAHMSMIAGSSQHAAGHSREEYPHYTDKLRGEIAESPNACIDQIRIPLQLLQSVFDANCVPEQAVQAYHSMRAANPDIPCRLVIYPDSNHGLLYRGPVELALRQRLDNLEWFERHL